MNNHFKRWIKKAAMTRTDSFTAKMILQSIVDERGTSSCIGTVAAIGWYLSRLDSIIKVEEGLYKVKKNEN